MYTSGSSRTTVASVGVFATNQMVWSHIWRPWPIQATSAAKSPSVTSIERLFPLFSTGAMRSPCQVSSARVLKSWKYSGLRKICLRKCRDESLVDAMESFGDGQRRIDLLVGTHYDADHLDGLIPNINDGSIVI